MKVIVGLGNPGRRYARTRHNIGFAAVDAVAAAFGLEISREKHQSLIGIGMLDREKLILAKPQTYMNESGRAVAAILRDVCAAPADLIVIHDELDLPLGSVRIKLGGGHAGHNGLRSIIEHIGSADFIRVRVGVGRPGGGVDAADYVLSPFEPEERDAAEKSIALALEAVKALLALGATKAMNIFNMRNKA